VGTGSGCIAVTLACELPAAAISATDISTDALAVAAQNARRHNVADRLTLLPGHLLTPINWQPDIIVANLPYVTNAEWTGLSDGAKWYEPAIALKGGEDGLDLVRQLLAQARSKLSPNGALFLEIGWKQGPAALQITRLAFPAARVTVEQDLAGHDRFVVVDLTDA
jgi:release factor glutamine methyltransferase